MNFPYGGSCAQRINFRSVHCVEPGVHVLVKMWLYAVIERPVIHALAVRTSVSQGDEGKIVSDAWCP